MAVNTWYRVGSRDEKPGQYGLAHLAEHLMFEGSFHLDKDLLREIESLGGSDCNGTTDRDRTRFFMTVPAQNLDAALWLESDRMGYLLDSLSQEKLDRARAIVIREIQQRRNDPYHLAKPLLAELSFPPEHPYSHLPLGTIEDLHSITLTQVREWFAAYYNPSNAVLVIAGDIDSAHAIEKAGRFFGGLHPAPPSSRDRAWLPRHSQVRRHVVFADVPAPRLYKVWNVPGYASPDLDYLDLFRHILASRLQQRLQDEKGLASNVSVSLRSFELGGQLRIEVDALPEAALSLIEEEAHSVLGRLIVDGPAMREFKIVQAQLLSSMHDDLKRLGGLGGKTDILAISELFSGDPAHHQRVYERLQKARTGDVRQSAARWLSGSASVLHVKPRPKLRADRIDVDRTQMPPVQRPQEVKLPPLHSRVLSNRLSLVVAPAEQPAWFQMELIVHTPTPQRWPVAARLARLCLEIMTTRQFDLQLSRLGMDWKVRCPQDTCGIRLYGPTAHLGAAVAQLGSLVADPEFPPARFQVGHQQILEEMRLPVVNSRDLLRPLLEAGLFGRQRPFTNPYSSYLEAMAQIDLKTLTAFFQEWFHPANAALVIVAGTPSPKLERQASRAFARWQSAARPEAAEAAPEHDPVPGAIYAVDRPVSQAVIRGGMRLPGAALHNRHAWDILVQSLDRRINRRLRSARQWSYSAGAALQWSNRQGRLSISADAPASLAGETIREVESVIRSASLPGQETALEVAKLQTASLYRLARSVQTDENLFEFLCQYIRSGIDYNYYAALGRQIGAVRVEDVTAAASLLKHAEKKMVWLVQGRRDEMEGSLAELGREVQWLVEGTSAKNGGARLQSRHRRIDGQDQ